MSDAPHRADESLSTAPDSTLGAVVESMKHMTKAVLYARVSSDGQKQERTIESQIVELKRQIAAAGHVLVKEYIDDGYSGARLDRPALEQLREDLKTDIFEAVYFLNADRIAREVAYQTIIVGELLKYDKQIIINGKDYVHNPENKFTLTVLGAVAELERAKIIERMARGKLHRLRMGEIAPNGHCTFGYEYVKKTPQTPPALVINEAQAQAIHSMFEMYARGAGLCAITRWLEERQIATFTGKRLWSTDHVRDMLQNSTYAGIRYFNRLMNTKDAHDGGRKKTIARDRGEWIAVKVPAIVPQELFDKVQERIRQNGERYRQPSMHYLLSGVITCGECGSKCHSYRRYLTQARAGGRRAVYHKAAYKCNWRARQNMHTRAAIDRCHNPEIATHILENNVFEMIREIMLDPRKLRDCLKLANAGGEATPVRAGRQLTEIAEQIKSVNDRRRRLIERYATDELGEDAYINENQALDEELARLRREKTVVVKRMRDAETDDTVMLSLAQFCDSARMRLDGCDDHDALRQFLRDYIETVIYGRHKVALVGWVPVLAATGDTKLQFRIEGEINRARAKSPRKRPRETDHTSTRETSRTVTSHYAIAV